MIEELSCVVMRGGTSKAVFLREDDLPADKVERERLILRVFGSPDRRQIDGLGGADPLTSKLAIIAAPGGALRDTADLVYTFGQVGIDTPKVDWHSLCGNITAAVGVYAVQEGFVAADGSRVRVRIFNSNLKRHLYVEVPLSNGVPEVSGDYRVPGVPGSGAMILIDFADTAGAATGSLLPTGNPCDEIAVEGLGPVTMSLVDIGNAHVFVRARDVGMTGIETPSQIDADKDLLARLETIRGTAAVRMGMAEHARGAQSDSPATPILGIVAEPADYPVELTGGAVSADQVDLVSRLQFMQQTHKTYAGTSTVCTGVASRIPGTVVHDVARTANEHILRIGHPAGVIETESLVENTGSGLHVRRATLGRTARRIFDGTVYTGGCEEDAA